MLVRCGGHDSPSDQAGRKLSQRKLESERPQDAPVVDLQGEHLSARTLRRPAHSGLRTSPAANTCFRSTTMTPS
jgi:hypothetical protein